MTDDSLSIQLWSNDVFWLPRIQDAASAAGYRLDAIPDPAAIGADSDFSPRQIPLTEPLEGPDAALVRYLSESHPALIIVDLNSDALPWARWIQVIKTSAATRRIPILAFGAHVETDKLKRAEQAGADIVLSRGRFQRSLTELINEWARPSLLKDLQAACRGSASDRALNGIALHNKMDFYEAHEELELAWMEAPEHEGYLYRALLQTTVAYLHLERKNIRGAAKMLLRVRQWLDPLPDICRGIDIDDLRENVDELRTYVDEAASADDLPEIKMLHRPFRFKD